MALPEITTNNSLKITSYISTENSSRLPIYEKDAFYSGDGMEEVCKKIKSYKFCLEELRKSTGYNEHMKLGNKITSKTFDEIIKVLADVMVLNAEYTVTINK